jgi:nitrogen fixation protein FixH
MTITSLNDSRARSPQAGDRFGRWIPWSFVGLFFLVLAVNGTMIAIAVSSFTGLETTNAYQRGLPAPRSYRPVTQRSKALQPWAGW